MDQYVYVVISSVFGVLALGVAFVALFKSGKRETKMDNWVQKNIINDPDAPVWAKEAAAKVQALNLTDAAQGIKGYTDQEFENKVRDIVLKVLKGG